MAGAALDKPPQPAAYPLGMGQGAMELGVMDRAAKGLAQEGRAQSIGRTQILSNALGARVGPHGQGMPYPNISFKPAQGNQENVAHPHQQKPPQPTVGPAHSHSNPRQRQASMRAAQ